MSSSPENPNEVDVAQASQPSGAAASPAHHPVASNGNPTPASLAPRTGNGSSPDAGGTPVTPEGENPPPASPDPGGTPQQPQQPPPAPAPQGFTQAPPAGQPRAGVPGYVQGQGMPPQPPPAYPGYPAYPQQPGGPYERRGLMQAWYEYPALRWLTVILV